MQKQIGVLLTSSRHVSGLYELGSVRISDALNNPLESVVRLASATLGRLANPNANEATPLALLPKAHIALVYTEPEARSTAARLMGAYVPKRTSALLVLIAGLRVRGLAHGVGPLDPVELHRLVSQGNDRFVVLTDARLALDVEGTSEREIGVAMLNVRHIHYVAQDNSAAERSASG